MNADLVTATPKQGGICVVCRRREAACICLSHAPVPVEQLSEIADQPTRLCGRRWSAQAIENLVQEAHKHYYNRDPAALERMVRGLFE
jgi:hypothetical protein